MAADVGRLEVLLNPLSLHRPRTHLRTPSKLKATIFCSTSDTGEQNQQGSLEPVARSSRGRTRNSLGLEEAKLTSCQPAQVSVLPTTLKERERDGIRPLSADRVSNAATLLHNSEKKSYGGMAKNDGQKQGITSNVEDLERKSLTDWERRNKPPVEDSEGDTPVMNPTETRQQIQDMINTDLARRYPSDDEDSGDEMPLYVDEDDPYWLDEPDEGWGFKVSDIFKEGFGVKNRKKYSKDSDDDDDVSDIPEMDWDYETEKFSAVDVDSMSWTSTVLGDPRPLVALIYDRYGKTGRECYHLLRELEDAANRMWETKRMPPRLAKINASFEEDLVGAIGIKEIPTLLFVKGGKLIHYQSGYLTADDILKIMSYFYHGAARPKCLKVPPKEKATVEI